MTTSTIMVNFPQELLLIVKELVAADDLRTHVCFYLSSPRVAALYDTVDSPDAFWELACWNNGLGGDVINPDSSAAFDDVMARKHPSWPRIERMPSWKDVAIKYISQDGFCTHPRCGEALLERNRQRMREAANHVEPLKPVHYEVYCARDPPFAAHDLFKHVEYEHLEQIYYLEPRPALHDAHLRPVGGPLRKLDEKYRRDYKADDYSGLYLAEHPFAARSFAVLPPVTSIRLFNHLTGPHLPDDTISRSRAIEIHDVVCVVHDVLDNELLVGDTQDYIDEHHECFPKALALNVAISAMYSTRSILCVCPITSLKYEDLTEQGPAFSFTQL